MRKKIKIVLILLVCLVIAFSMVITAVQLKIIEFDSKDNISNEKPTIQNNPPVASFTYANELYTVIFTDKSTDKENDILTYNWDFGDGAISTEKTPIHTYDCSETNVFDITLTVSDGEFSDTHTEHILFGSHLNIIDYSQTWTGYDSYEKWGIYDPVWIGDISMTIKNTGNIPSEISRAKINSKEKVNNYPRFSGDIYFNFTYTYEELVGGGNGLESELWITVISNNTLTLDPGKMITLTSNPELSYVMWGVGIYPVNIWLYEKENGKDVSHTLHETVVELT